MRITDIFSSRAVATRETKAASNRIPYFGEGLFPARKKLGLDLFKMALPIPRVDESMGLEVALQPDFRRPVSIGRPHGSDCHNG